METYRLISVSSDGSRRPVGSYADYRRALAARVEDVLTQLRANSGGWIRAEHLIVGPGVGGPATSHPLCCELDAGSPDAGSGTDYEQARCWLLWAHGLLEADAGS